MVHGRSSVARVVEIIPVLIDEQPSFVSRDDACGSLLAMPCVDGSLGDLWRGWLAPICKHAPHEVSRDVADDGAMTLADVVRDPLAVLDPFDWVLFVASRLVPASTDGLSALRRRHEEGESAVLHLLATSADAVGSREVVYETPEGGVRRIQRYLDPVASTQPSAGVIASLVSVQSLLRIDVGTVIASLDDLRAALVQRGVTSTDLQQEGHVFDVGEEEGALAFVHDRVRASRRRLPWSIIARGAVVIEDGAHVADDVLIVGPTLIASGARIGKGARLAQCILMPGTEVPAGASVRHRIVSGHVGHDVAPPRRHATASSTVMASQIVPRQSRYQEVRSWVEASIALVVLVLLAPFFGLLAMAIKLTSPGPVFYGDRREGLGARTFRCWKFRTMRVNAHAMQRQLASEQFADGPHFKMDRDPRLTPIGGLLRRLNIDELPQLFNVVCREMSFVGPRPSPLRENQICAPWRRARLSVRPGITGLWQVCRHNRAAGDFHQWIEYDLRYVEHLSFAVDLRIFLATIRTAGGRWPVPVTSIIPALGDVPVEREPADDIELAIVSARRLLHDADGAVAAQRAVVSSSRGALRWKAAEPVR